MPPPQPCNRTRVPATTGTAHEGQSKRVQHAMPTETPSAESPAAKPPDPGPAQNDVRDPGPPSSLQRPGLPAAVVLGSITLIAVTGYEVLSLIRLLTESPTRLARAATIRANRPALAGRFGLKAGPRRPA